MSRDEQDTGPAGMLGALMETAPNRIGILVVDDHPLLREGIAAVIGGQPDMQVLAEATNGVEAVELFALHRPDITLMDLQMPEMNGIDAIAGIRAHSPSARVVVLTTYHGDVQALHAFQAGASGYLLKNMLRKELIDTIRVVHAGGKRIPPEIANEIAKYVASEALSAREVEVLRQVAGGNANKRVAAHLGISEETVKAHMKSILSKLGANDRTHAVTIAFKRGIIEA